METDRIATAALGAVRENGASSNGDTGGAGRKAQPPPPPPPPHPEVIDLGGADSSSSDHELTEHAADAGAVAATGAWPYNRPCAQQYVGKSQSCMVTSGRLIVHEPVRG